VDVITEVEGESIFGLDLDDEAAEGIRGLADPSMSPCNHLKQEPRRRRWVREY
jgi:hypothetical protein